jgi:glycosyltransferase involved in cell wall biosynthesis
MTDFSGIPSAAPDGRPTASVVIPVLNGAEFIAKAISSVLEQTMSDLELIVIDDGSTDATPQIVRAFRDPRLRYFYQPNRGLSGARNTGIRQARAPWIAFLDCDDYWMPRKLEAQLEAATAAPEVGLVYCAGTYRNVAGDMLADLPAVVEGNALEQLLVGNCVAGSASSAMVSRATLDRVGLFDENLTCCEDWDMWIRVAAVTTFAKVEERLVTIVTRPGSATKNADKLRDVSIKLVNDAIAKHGGGRNRLRRRALSYVHRSAAYTHHDHGRFAEALRELVKAARYRPTDVRLYWRMARVISCRS